MYLNIEFLFFDKKITSGYESYYVAVVPLFKSDERVLLSASFPA